MGETEYSFIQPNINLSFVGNYSIFDQGTMATNVSEGFKNTSSGSYALLKQPVHMVVVYSLAYTIVFLLGVVGNSFVVAVVYRNKRMHNVTNYFIVNLAIADVFVCIFCLPITLINNLFSGWRIGAFLCKATPYLQGVAVSASVNTLAAIALDRYLAICHTLEFRMTKKIARLIIVFIWLLACAIMVPWPIYYQHVDFTPNSTQKVYICVQKWPNPQSEGAYFLGAIFLTCYTIPLLLISTCYAFITCKVWNRNAPGIANTSKVIYRSKVKVLKMLVVVVILFAFSWLPLWATNVRMYFGPMLMDNTLEYKIVSKVIIPVAQWLGSANSCVNPIIYAFFSKKYRLGFKQIMKCGTAKENIYLDRKCSTLYQSVHDGNGHVVYKTMKLSPDKSRLSDESTYV